MRKVFTLLLMSIITSIGVWAQEKVGATASADFIVRDGGKTLTVSGKGDLTTLNITATELSFTKDGLSNVKITNDQYNGTAATNPYNSKTTYYAKHYVETQVEADALQNATVTYSWTAAGLSLYYTSDNGWTWTQVTSGSSVDLTGNHWEGNTQYSNYSTNNNGTERIPLADFKIGGYYTTTITGDNITFNGYASNYYKKTEEGYQAMTQGETYDSNTTYYNISAFGVVTEEEMKESGYLGYATDSFVNLLNAMILDGAKPENNGVTTNFTTVRFVNEGSPTPLIINDEIVHAILFPTYDWGYGVVTKAKNYSIETLDLGAATIIDLNADAFKNGNSLANMTNLTLPLTKKTLVDSETSSTNVEKMVVPGDVLNVYKDYKTGDANLKTVTIPEGYDRLGDNAFVGQNRVETFNLPSTLKLIGESAFENCYAMKSIKLNEGLENIGKRAFVGTNLTDITFPSTLRIINDAAFADLKDIKDLKFNAGLYYIGNTAFGLKDAITLNTIQIPASVKFIGACAFYSREYKDVYFLGENAPIMPIGTSTYNTSWTNCTAFPANILMGNNGFEKGTKGQMPTVTDMKDDAESGYANRENYHNQRYYFAILHFPTGLTDDQRAKYTDITRVYKTHRDADGNFYYWRSDVKKDSYDEVGEEKETLTFGACTASTKVCYGFEDTYLGSQYIWPSQEQWNRSYAVNSNGYNWDGVTKYRPTLSKEDKEVLEYAGYKIGTGEGQYTEEYLQMIAHMGTRQFVLTNADTKKDTDTEEEPVYPISMTGNNWWTICVPFSMTKAQVDEVFGPGTHVCRFSSVKRTEDSNGNKSITLCFQNDVYATKWTRNPETLAYNKESGGPADDDIVIYSHEAYMIYPTKSNDDANNMYNIKDYKLETGSPLPTIIKANADDKTEGADHTEYRFVGNYVTEVSTGTATNADAGVATAAYETVTIPQYSYIYATKKGYAAYKFWFFTGTNMAWSPNKCVVQATARDGGAKDYKNFFGGNVNGSKVSQVSLFGEDGTVTEIENVTIIAGEGENAQIVYNLNGQVVSSNGNTDRLAKGVYIKGGKKFMVK